MIQALGLEINALLGIDFVFPAHVLLIVAFESLDSIAFFYPPDVCSSSSRPSTSFYPSFLGVIVPMDT